MRRLIVVVPGDGAVIAPNLPGVHPDKPPMDRSGIHVFGVAEARPEPYALVVPHDSQSNNWLLGNGVALARRPDLWRTALRVARVHAPSRWWAKKPFLPVPDEGWMDFRFETAFADVDGRPEPHQLIEYLEWCRSWKYL